jgi:hypothetical protein
MMVRLEPWMTVEFGRLSPQMLADAALMAAAELSGQHAG